MSRKLKKIITMKKIVLSLVALMTFIFQSHAQDEKGYIGISLGPSIPMGDLSSKDADNDAAGWANTGAVFDISFAYKLGEGNFGITALLRGQANPTDAQGLADELANQVAGVNWTVESDGWGIGGLMFGGFGSFPISEKTSFAQHCISVMRAELLKLSIFAPKKLCGTRTVNCSEIPHYAYT
jgi:hypothetical protein